MAAGELADPLDALLPSFRHDIGGAEPTAEIRAIAVAAHENDPLRSEPLRGEHRHQTDRAVADDRHRAAPGHATALRGVMARAENVGQREQRRNQRRVLRDGQLHQGAVGKRDPHGLRLAALIGDAVPEPGLLVGARSMQPLDAESAGVVGDRERRHHQVAPAQRRDVRTDVLDDTDELVPHPRRTMGRIHRVIRMQIRTADAAGRHPDQRVGGQFDAGVGDVLDADVAGAVHEGRAHDGLASVCRESSRKITAETASRDAKRRGRTWIPKCGPAVQVELRGLEPLTPTLPVWCATSCAIAPYRIVFPRTLAATENRRTDFQWS